MIFTKTPRIPGGSAVWSAQSARSRDTLCLCANGGETESVATVSCNNEFVAPACNHDLVLGRGEVVRRGRSIVFSRCRLSVEDKVILVASAVIKRIRNSSQ